MAAKNKRRKSSQLKPAIGGDVRTNVRLIADHKAFWLALAVIILLSAVVHSPGLNSQARHVDDAEYLEHNPLVQSPSWSTGWRFMSEVIKPSSVGGYYHPLTMISLMIDYAMGGDVNDLTYFHRTSLLLHLATTAGVLFLFYLLFENIAVAAIVALIFGVHPLSVEIVDWMGARKAVLAGCFSAWMLVCYVAYARTQRIGFYVLACLMLILALLSKPTALPLVGMVLVLDIWPLNRLNWDQLNLNKVLLIEKIPLVLITATFVAIILASHFSTTKIEMPRAYSSALIPVMVCYKNLFCIGKVLMPVGLSAYYEQPTPFSLDDMRILASVVAAIVLIVAAIICWRRGVRSVAVGLAFFLVAFSPMSGLFKYGAGWVFIFDNYIYIPMLGILLILADGLKRWADRQPLALASRITLPPVESLAICAVLIIAAVFQSSRYIAKWDNTEDFYAYMIDLYPEAGMLHNHLGLERSRLAREERKQEDISVEKVLVLAGGSIKSLRRAVELTPDTEKDKSEMETNLGTALWVWSDLMKKLGNVEEGHQAAQAALIHLERGLELNPGDIVALYNLAKIYIMLGLDEQAEAKYLEAISLPERVSKLRERIRVWFSYGQFLEARGRPEDAKAAYREVLNLKPDHIEARQRLNALEKIGAASS